MIGYFCTSAEDYADIKKYLKQILEEIDANRSRVLSSRVSEL
jgi:hypothetical protein